MGISAGKVTDWSWTEDSWVDGKEIMQQCLIFTKFITKRGTIYMREQIIHHIQKCLQNLAP